MLCYEIETDDFFKEISQDIDQKFDTSNFPKNHKSEIPTGKKSYRMKDETGGKIIEEFVGLRAKMYPYKMLEGKEEKKCKGVEKAAVKKITRCLFEGENKMMKMNTIRLRYYEIFTERLINKVALSCKDDKRNIQKDGVQTLAYGHCSRRDKSLCFILKGVIGQ